jgi:hypothetical protein
MSAFTACIILRLITVTEPGSRIELAIVAGGTILGIILKHSLKEYEFNIFMTGTANE